MSAIAHLLANPVTPDRRKTPGRPRAQHGSDRREYWRDYAAMRYRTDPLYKRARIAANQRYKEKQHA